MQPRHVKQKIVLSAWNKTSPQTHGRLLLLGSEVKDRFFFAYIIGPWCFVFTVSEHPAGTIELKTIQISAPVAR